MITPSAKKKLSETFRKILGEEEEEIISNIGLKKKKAPISLENAEISQF